MNKVVLSLLCGFLLVNSAFAGTSTITVLDSVGGTQTYSVITNGSSNFISQMGVCDGTAAAQCAAVKAASTAAIGSDPALVVAISPNNTIGVSQSGTWNINNISGTISLPTGAATSALQSTMNTTLGSPFQAGGSIGNTSFAATQATASSLNATVVGTGTFAVQATQSGTWNITNISGTISLPTGASTAANQTNASQKTQIVDGSGNVIASTSNSLNVQCANCSGSGASATDAATFTAGTSTFAPAGGEFTSGGATACVTGHQCLVGITAARAFLTDNSSVAGNTTLTGNGTTGTGSQRVTIASDNTAFSVNAVESGTWNITNISGTISLPTGAATSANQTNASQKTQIVDGSGNVIAATSNALNVQCANCSGSGVSTADAATFTAGTSLFAGGGGEFTSGGATACVTGHQCMVGMTAARAFLTDVSSVNGVTTLTGTGAVGTGAQRIAVGTDTATIAGSAPGTAGTASTNVVSIQGITSMTPVQVSQATAANLNATVVGTGTFAVQAAQSGTWNITNISGTVSLPTGASTSANQTNASQKTQIVDGSGNVIASTSNNLNVQCANCSGSGASAADAATFTAGTSTFAPAGGEFTTGGATACVTGHQCLVGITAARAFLTDVSSIGGTTVLAGTGAVGTGAQRIAVGTDTATIAGSAPGTAGSASANVLTIQGVTSMTPVQVSQATASNLNATVSQATGTNLHVVCDSGCAGGGTSIADAGTFTAGTTVGTPAIGQFTSGGATACVTGHACWVGITSARGFLTDTSTIGGTAVLTGTGAVGTGAQRVAVGTDTATIAGSAPGTAGSASTNVLTIQGVASMTPVAVNQTQYLGTAVAANPCLTGTILYVSVSQTANTQVASLGGSSKKNYICAINLVGADAENVSIVEGTGTVCATTTGAIMGGTTAAAGWNFASNGGIVVGNGAAAIAAGALTSLNNVCIFQSGSGRVAGSIVISQQ